MNPLVEFCMSNLSMGAQEVFDLLEQDPNLDVLEYDCLSFCSVCEEGLYAFVNGEIVRGDTAEQLTKNIYQHLEDNPMF